MKNITSRADVFPFPKSFLDHLNRRTKIKLRCRCFVNFFCGDAVFVIFFCGVAVLTVPQCPPLEVNQTISRCDDYWELNRVCFMSTKEMITTEIASYLIHLVDTREFSF